MARDEKSLQGTSSSSAGSVAALAGVGGVDHLRGLELRAGLQRRALTLAAAYAAAAGTWIALSDRLLGALVRDAALLVQLSLIKGAAFVAATAALLYLLLRRTFRAVERAFVAVERKEAERLAHEAQRRRAEAIVESTDDAIVGTTL